MRFEIVDLETAKRPRGLTVGDAIVVIALLVFVLGWVGGWIWVIGHDHNPKDHIDDWATIWLFIIIGWPAIWAGSKVSDIIERGHSR